MIMARILILIILVWILYQIIKRVAGNVKQKTSTNAEQKFVRCTKCGCHIPESESHLMAEKVVCNNPECLQSSEDNPNNGA